MAGATVTVANNGPVRISGDFVIKDAQGRGRCLWTGERLLLPLWGVKQQAVL